MANQYWGESPEILTVESSPSPTTTTLTVSSAANLLEGQFILVEVDGDFERTQITSIVGDALTISPALSDVPDTPGEVRNSRELITRTQLNNGAVFNAASIADLKTVDTSYTASGLKYHVAGVGTYLLDKSSAVTGDDYTVIAPTTGGGRWLLQLGGNVWQTVTGATTMASGGRYIANNSTRVPFTSPASPAVGAEFEVVNRGTGGFSISLNSGQTLRNNASEYAYGQQLNSSDAYAAVRMLCTASNQFTVLNAQGSISFATVGAGYVMGGTNSGYQSSIYRLTFATEVIDTPSATLDSARSQGAGGQSSTTGYCFGGLNGGGRSALIDDLNFATQASAQIGSTLAVANLNFSAACSSTSAYRFGGGPITGTSDAIWEFVFASATDTLLGATLSNARDSSVAISDTTDGYRVGGNGGTEVDKFSFSAETRSTISATLPATRQRAMGGQKAGMAGVVMGGDVSGVVSSIIKLTLPGEVISTVAATLNTGRQQAVGVNSVVKSFALGGDTNGAGTASSLIDDFDYSNDTSAQLAATLPAARIGAVGVSSLV